MHIAVACAAVLTFLLYAAPNVAAAQGTSTGTGGGRSERGDGQGPGGAGAGNKNDTSRNNDRPDHDRPGHDRPDHDRMIGPRAESPAKTNEAIKREMPDIKNPVAREFYRGVAYMGKTHGKGGNNAKSEGIKGYQAGLKAKEAVDRYMAGREQRRQEANKQREQADRERRAKENEHKQKNDEIRLP